MHIAEAARTEPGIVIVGGGTAGLSLALRLADRVAVTLIAKAALTEGSSLYAQGGVAAVLDESDSIAAHVEDTVRAGAGLCHYDSVKFLAEHARANIEWLRALGVEFSVDAASGRLHLTREGGHGHRRVVHAADATGRAMQTALEARVRAHRNIRVVEHAIAIDLVTSGKLGWPGENRCVGLYVLDKGSGAVHALPARVVALASGGASKAYLYTTNPDTSTGDGIAMAWRAGCRVANLEFVQFHPTCLYHPAAKSFLISEAVRGEGGRLLLPDGRRFMPDHDPRAELAPRDVVARAIDFEMKRGGFDCVYLDISHKPAEFVTTHFPTIYRRCLEFGFDMTRAPLPVVPAAHYTCGGVMTDLHGCTDLAGLYAVGECAFTGVHGANRLASNSLLECLVFAEAAAHHIQSAQRAVDAPARALPAWDESRVADADEQVIVAHNWDELRRFMWDYVGIVRTTKRLHRALHRVTLLQDEIREYYANFKVTNDLVELRNLALAAELVIRSALARTESRGLHYSRDYPALDPERAPQDTILTPPNFAGAAIPPGAHAPARAGA